MDLHQHFRGSDRLFAKIPGPIYLRTTLAGWD
jgi:hypothetical protein